MLAAFVAFVYWRFVNGTDYWTKRGVRQPEKPPTLLGGGNNVFLHSDIISNKEGDVKVWSILYRNKEGVKLNGKNKICNSPADPLQPVFPASMQGIR